MPQIVKTEFYDRKTAKWVLENIQKIKYRTINDYKYDPIEQIKLLCEKILKTKDGKIQVIYTQGKNINFGRYYANVGKKQLGYQTLLREFRHTLANKYYYDIDIKNCQPVILEQYCKKNGINCNMLSDYIKKRDFILKNMGKKYNLTKDEVKQQFITIIMGGKISKDLITSDTLTAFYNEMQVIQKEIADRNQSFYKYAKNRKDKEYNINGSTTAYLLQDIESQIIISADNFFTKNGWSSDVLVYDGLMIRKTKEITENDLLNVNKYVEKEHGYKVEFLIKPMDEGYDITDEELNEITFKNDNAVIVENDEEASEYVLNVIEENESIIYESNRYFMKVNGNIYKEDLSQNNKELKNKLIALIGSCNLCKESKTKDGNTEIRPYSKNASGANNILTFVMAKLKETEKFIDALWESNAKKLCFKNGYWDFENNKFIFWDDKKQLKKVYTTIYIDKDFIDVNKMTEKEKEQLEEGKKWVYENVLNPIFANDDIQRDYFLKWISQAIAGEFQIKSWAVGIGNRNCGKGVLCYLLKNTFGNYVREFNAEEMICTRIGTGDTAKKLAWVIPFEFTRLNISNELKTEDDKDRKMKLDGNIIKHISGGGDTQTARRMFKDEMQFRIQGKMLLMMNEMINVAPTNVLESLTTFKFNAEFKTELTKEEQEINEIGNYKFQIANPNIKNEIINNKHYQRGFLQIILENYTNKVLIMPDEMKELNTDYHDNTDSNENKLKEIFEFTRNKKDKITISDVDKLIKEYFCNSLSKSAYKLVFDRNGIITGRETDKELNKLVRYYYGIKKIQIIN